MKFFEALSIVSSSRNKEAQSIANRMLSSLKKATPFYFASGVCQEKGRESVTLSSQGIEELVDLGQEIESFSLPFKSVLYLMKDVGFEFANGDWRYPVGILIDEISPEKFFTSVIGFDSNENVYHHQSVVRLGENASVFNAGTVEYNFIKLLTNSVSVKRVGIEKSVSVQFKNRLSPIGFTKLKWDCLYHVADKVEYHYSPFGDDVDFKYGGHWRGHWRAFYLPSEGPGRRTVDHKKIGKDRAGIYQVEGYTWVTEHTRGSPELAQIKSHHVN